MQSGSTRISVVPKAGGGWLVRELATGPVLATTETKNDAFRRGWLVLESGRGGTLLVLGADGLVERTVMVKPGPPRKWWYVPSGLPRWLMPVLFGFQLALRTLDRLDGILSLLTAVGLAVCLVGSLSAALASWASDRRRIPSLEAG